MGSRHAKNTVAVGMARVLPRKPFIFRDSAPQTCELRSDFESKHGVELSNQPLQALILILRRIAFQAHSGASWW